MSVNAQETDPRITRGASFESIMSSEDSDTDSAASIGKYCIAFLLQLMIYRKIALYIKKDFFKKKNI